MLHIRRDSPGRGTVQEEVEKELRRRKLLAGRARAPKRMTLAERNRLARAGAGLSALYALRDRYPAEYASLYAIACHARGVEP